MEWLSTTETAEVLGRTPKAVRQLVKRGRLKPRKFDGRLRFRSDTVFALITPTPDEIDATIAGLCGELDWVRARLEARSAPIEELHAEFRDISGRILDVEIDWETTIHT